MGGIRPPSKNPICRRNSSCVGMSRLSISRKGFTSRRSKRAKPGKTLGVLWTGVAYWKKLSKHLVKNIISKRRIWDFFGTIKIPGRIGWKKRDMLYLQV